MISKIVLIKLKTMKTITKSGLVLIILLVATITLKAQELVTQFPKLAGPYLGQQLQGKIAIPFANGLFEKDIYSSIIFSNDGKEAYWSTQNNIFCSKQINGTWTQPEPLNLIPGKPTCPVLSPDNKRLYFNDWMDGKIYFSERTGAGWSKPSLLSEVINSTPNIHWNIAVDNKGNIFLTSGKTNKDVRILYSEFKNGEYTKPVILAELKDQATICPYVAPDGAYLIYVKTILNPQRNDKAFFIMFKNKSGQWGKEINISEIIGGKGFCPNVSRDGKYFFFFNNGTMYWADASFIEDLRKEALKDDK